MSARQPASLLTDLDTAFALIPDEPDAHALLTELLGHTPVPRHGLAVVLRSRLGGLARAFAQQHRSWRVTAVDPSVALLSASLEAIRPAGLSCQLTVMQSHPPALPLDDTSVHLLLADLPLAHLANPSALATWCTELRRVMAPAGRFILRVARPGAHWPPDWPPAFRTALASPAAGAFSVEAVCTHLAATGLQVTVRDGNTIGVVTLDGRS